MVINVETTQSTDRFNVLLIGVELPEVKNYGGQALEYAIVVGKDLIEAHMAHHEESFPGVCCRV